MNPPLVQPPAAYETLAGVQYLVVHCSATRPSMAWTVADIDRAHRAGGWVMVGYHYVIRRDGTLDRGRPDDMVGAHEPRVNRRSLGICLVGGVAQADGWTPECNFTPEQFATLRALLEELQERHPGAQILGHRDIPGVRKACPCFDTRAWWRSGGALQPMGIAA